MKQLILSALLLQVTTVNAQNANTTLSNLVSPTVINQALLPGTGNTLDIGSSSKTWRNIYLNGALYMNGSKVLSNGGNTNNLFVGFSAGRSSTGIGNVFAGPFAGYANTTGHDNTAIGYFAMFSNAVTYQNTAVGSYALFYNSSGYYNTAVGYHALMNNVSGYYNTAIGTQALDNTNSSGNTAVGERAGAIYENGWGNTFLGQQCWAAAGGYQYSTCLGYNARITASNQVRIGSSTVTSIGGYRAWTNLSDGRFKKNIKENVPGLAFINKLRPITYNLDIRAVNDFVNKGAPVFDKNGKAIIHSEEDEKSIIQQEKIVTTGLVAQDVEKAAKELNYDFDGVDAPKNEKDYYGLRYAEFVVPLVKAVQELSKMNNEKDAKINELEERLEKIEKAFNSQTGNIKSAENIVLKKAALEQNAPNPFTGNTVIRYNLPSSVNQAQIIVSNTAGSTIKTFALNSMGSSSVTIPANALAAGIYYYTLFADGKKVDSKKMILVK